MRTTLEIRGWLRCKHDFRGSNGRCPSNTTLPVGQLISTISYRVRLHHESESGEVERGHASRELDLHNVKCRGRGSMGEVDERTEEK